MALVDQSLLKKRFAELAAQAEAVNQTAKKHVTDYFDGFQIDEELFLAWVVKTRNLIVKACGPDSEHYKEFIKQEQPQSFRDSHGKFKDLRAVFSAAREDFDGGYLNTIRNLVQAEVFSSELDQARELYKAGYIVAAAVVAGVVLETTMRQQCVDRGLAIGNLNKMNADLAKDGCYNLLVSKRITALADIRNNAAHGNPDKFVAADVADMISKVEDFVADQL